MNMATLSTSQPETETKGVRFIFISKKVKSNAFKK